MKTFAFSIALIAALSLPARADFTIVQKVEAKGKASEITLKIKGDKIRMEATPQMTMIVDGRTGDTITLMNAQKRIVRISGDKAKAIAERELWLRIGMKSGIGIPLRIGGNLICVLSFGAFREHRDWPVLGVPEREAAQVAGTAPFAAEPFQPAPTDHCRRLLPRVSLHRLSCERAAREHKPPDLLACQISRDCNVRDQLLVPARESQEMRFPSACLLVLSWLLLTHFSFHLVHRNRSLWLVLAHPLLCSSASWPSRAPPSSSACARCC